MKFPITIPEQDKGLADHSMIFGEEEEEEGSGTSRAPWLDQRIDASLMRRKAEADTHSGITDHGNDIATASRRSIRLVCERSTGRMDAAAEIEAALASGSRNAFQMLATETARAGKGRLVEGEAYQKERTDLYRTAEPQARCSPPYAQGDFTVCDLSASRRI
jgi:hypothetical protein